MVVIWITYSCFFNFLWRFGRWPRTSNLSWAQPMWVISSNCICIRRLRLYLSLTGCNWTKTEASLAYQHIPSNTILMALSRYADALTASTWTISFPVLRKRCRRHLSNARSNQPVAHRRVRTSTPAWHQWADERLRHCSINLLNISFDDRLVIMAVDLLTCEVAIDEMKLCSMLILLSEFVIIWENNRILQSTQHTSFRLNGSIVYHTFEHKNTIKKRLTTLFE